MSRLVKLYTSSFCKHVGAGGPLGTKGIGEQGYQHLTVIMDNLSSFVEMEEAATCTAEVPVRTLLRWCPVIGIPRVWVSDTAKHFKNRALRLLAEHLEADHRFLVANAARINGIVKKMMIEIVKTFRVVASAARIPLDWARIVSVVQAASNAGYRERFKVYPFNLMFGRKPDSIFLALVTPGKDKREVDSLDPNNVSVMVRDLMDAQEKRREEVLELVRKNLARMRGVETKGVLPDFAVGDYMLVARFR